MVGDADNPLFNAEDEKIFKQAFAIQFLATYDASNYSENCTSGWVNHSIPVEDAATLATHAWKEWIDKMDVPDVDPVEDPFAERAFEPEVKKEFPLTFREHLLLLVEDDPVTAKLIQDFIEVYGTAPHVPEILHRLWRSGMSLPDISKVVSVLSIVCNHCWDGPAATCSCTRNE